MCITKNPYETSGMGCGSIRAGKSVKSRGGAEARAFIGFYPIEFDISIGY